MTARQNWNPQMEKEWHQWLNTQNMRFINIYVYINAKEWISKPQSRIYTQWSFAKIRCIYNFVRPTPIELFLIVVNFFSFQFLSPKKEWKVGDSILKWKVSCFAIKLFVLVNKFHQIACDSLQFEKCLFHNSTFTEVEVQTFI